MIVILLEHGYLTEGLFNVVTLNCGLLKPPVNCNEGIRTIRTSAPEILPENRSALSPIAGHQGGVGRKLT